MKKDCLMGVLSQGVCLGTGRVHVLCRYVRERVILGSVGHIGELVDCHCGKVYGRVLIERVIACTDGAIRGNSVGLGKG